VPGLPRKVTVSEVGPRDGLQIEARHVPAATKIELIERLVASGIDRIEVTAFVHPRVVPQMADAEQVVAGVRRRAGVRYGGLALNPKGAERAIAAGVDDVKTGIAVSDSFNELNVRMTTEQGMKAIGEIAAIVAAKPPPLGERERQQLMQLGADLELAWLHPAATAATRKRILRTALNEIVVRKEGAVINMVLHWQGGDHTALHVKLRLNAAGRHHWPPPEDTIALLRELARLMPDRQIARLLNRSGKPTGYGNGWTEQRVRGFRKHHDIAVYRDGEWAERGEITLDAAASSASPR